ncbi:hypothetical protein ACIOEX_01390 [Streptomyces sp. NPDC087850]|uniref:hypothetical protein n=1 Tax=Streptomyces sp. NPDC087850 TaxID=3365809 RepID=UPI0038195ACD
MDESSIIDVQLHGGPFDGLTAPVNDAPDTWTAISDPNGVAARYEPDTNGVWRWVNPAFRDQ